jgi:hypothetical protein
MQLKISIILLYFRPTYFNQMQQSGDSSWKSLSNLVSTILLLTKVCLCTMKNKHFKPNVFFHNLIQKYFLCNNSLSDPFLVQLHTYLWLNQWHIAIWSLFILMCIFEKNWAQIPTICEHGILPPFIYMSFNFKLMHFFQIYIFLSMLERSTFRP